jgi:hypothetical protein
MKKWGSLLLIFLLFLNNISELDILLAGSSTGISEIAKIESPLLSMFSLAALPMKVFDIVMDRFVSADENKGKQPEKQTDKKRNTSSDIAVVTAETNYFQAIKSKAAESGDIMFCGSPRERSVLRIDIRGGPPRHHVNFLILFLLLCLLSLSKSNLPYGGNKMVLRDKITRFCKNRVFLLPGNCKSARRINLKKSVAVFTAASFLFSFVLQW